VETEGRKLKDWLHGFIRFCATWKNCKCTPKGCKGLESPVQYHLWSGVACISASLQRNIRLTNPFFNIYPNMYIVIVGPPGHGKTAAANVGVSMLKKATNVYFASDRLTPEQLLEEMQASTHLTERGGELFNQSPVFCLWT